MSGKQRAETRISELREELREHNHRYYILNNPIISDEKYDRLFRELIELEDKFPELVTADSPTQRVGAEPSDSFQKVEHRAPMLSLANAFGENELRAFDKRTKGMLEVEDIDYVTEFKIDGVAIALTYEKGVFVQGATRGNGEVGENITPNLKTIRSIPLRLRSEEPPQLVEVRGEAYLSLSAFDRLNRERTAADESPFANPRNATAGALRQLDSRVTASRPLSHFAYSIGYVEGFDRTLQTQVDVLETLEKWGFPVNPNFQHQHGIEGVIEYCTEWQEKRDELDYEIDGVVVKVNRLDYQESLGAVSRDPRWAVAYKFPGRIATTRLLEIKINVGRTGALNPYAVLEPVQLAGVTIRTATLHNEEDIQRKDIREGDFVVIKRAGDVIPQVVGPVREKRTGQEVAFVYPDNCPVCDSPVSKLEDEAMAYCTNRKCPSQRIEALKHFVSQGAMDIRGLGPQTLEKMVDMELISTPSDLYQLTDQELLQLPGYKEKSVSNLLESIEESKKRPMARVLFALGIRHVGESIAQLLADHLKSVDAVIDAEVEEISKIEGIGPQIAQSVHDYFQIEENLELIRELRQTGLSMGVSKTGESNAKGSPLDGFTFVITGTLSGFSRREIKSYIQNEGGRVTSAVTSKTDYVVAGENPGSKLEKAKKLGITVLSEEDLKSIAQGESG